VPLSFQVIKILIKLTSH